MVGWEDRGPKHDFLNGMKRQQFKFEKLQVWKDALEVQDSIYELVEFFPDCENITSHLNCCGHPLRLDSILQKGQRQVLIKSNSNLSGLRFVLKLRFWER